MCLVEPLDARGEAGVQICQRGGDVVVGSCGEVSDAGGGDACLDQGADGEQLVSVLVGVAVLAFVVPLGCGKEILGVVQQDAVGGDAGEAGQLVDGALYDFLTPGDC